MQLAGISFEKRHSTNPINGEGVKNFTMIINFVDGVGVVKAIGKEAGKKNPPSVPFDIETSTPKISARVIKSFAV